MNNSSQNTEDPDPANAAPLTDPQIPTPDEQLRDKAAKADEYWERLLRLAADLDNFKKRAARDRQDAIRFANESLIQKLLTSLDNLEMALEATQQSQSDALESLRTGVQMIHTQLKSALSEAGLQEINALGQPFDPAWHEAVSQLPSTTTPEGHVCKLIRKGYKLYDRLLRPASVIVASKPDSNP